MEGLVSVPAKPAPGEDPTTIVRALNGADALAIAMVESACPDAAQWGIGGYAHLDSGEISGFGVEQEGSLLAIIVVRIVASEIEILNLAVNPRNRREGLASQLLFAAIASGRKRGASLGFLEVRESNAAARAFYQSHGFQETGRRKFYYSHPYEDALVFTLSLS